jgi:hypothetical protein
MASGSLAWSPESAKYRAFIDRTVRELLDCASALLALGIEECFKGAIVARFEGSVLLEGTPNAQDKSATIARLLQAAFPASTFQLEFEKLP